MVIIIFYFDICIKFTLFMLKISCLYEKKKTVSDKPWQNMLHDKAIPS